MIDFPPLPSGEKPIWDGEVFHLGKRLVRVLSYSSDYSGWDGDLTALHETVTGDGRHPIDVVSRNTAINALNRYCLPADGAVLEIGCSSGFFLRDLKQAFPEAEIFGADVVMNTLERLGNSLSGVPLMQMDILQCPLGERQFDAVIALNVLEHIEDDEAALAMMAKLLKPNGILVLEVPQGPDLYDYFDSYLRHCRRYSKKELQDKIAGSGLRLQEIDFLGFVPYLPFWLVKKYNRMRFGSKGEKFSRDGELVFEQIKATTGSKVLKIAFSVENAVFGKIGAPIGIRCTAVARPIVN